MDEMYEQWENWDSLLLTLEKRKEGLRDWVQNIS